MRKILLPILLLFSSYAFSGNLSDTFSAHIFGLAWGASLEDVKEYFPNGKYSDKHGIKLYTVADDRALFDLDRKGQDIIFGFDDIGRLKGITAVFSEKHYSSLQSKLNTLFGPQEEITRPSSMPYAKWPIDNGIQISIVMLRKSFKNIVYFSVGKTNLPNPKTSASDIGF